MEVGHGQQLGGTRVEPLSACVALALGTVPVAARVIGDSLIAAAQTLVAMASESRSAATNDSIHDLAVLPGQVRSLPFPEVKRAGNRLQMASRQVQVQGGISEL